MNAPRFAIAQSGHSGSGYTAAALYAAGVACGHEQWWTLEHLPTTRDLDGDSSWLAITDPHFGQFDGPVFHQVREPLACIGSLAHYFRHGADDGYMRRRMDWMGEWATGMKPPATIDDIRVDALAMAMVAWCSFNTAAAERSVATWRVESFGAPHITMIASLCGLSLDPQLIAQAVLTTPTDFNAHGRETVTWDDLDEVDRDGAEIVADMATAYGYSTEDAP